MSDITRFNRESGNSTLKLNQSRKRKTNHHKFKQWPRIETG